MVFPFAPGRITHGPCHPQGPLGLIYTPDFMVSTCMGFCLTVFTISVSSFHYMYVWNLNFPDLFYQKDLFSPFAPCFLNSSLSLLSGNTVQFPLQYCSASQTAGITEECCQPAFLLFESGCYLLVVSRFAPWGKTPSQPPSELCDFERLASLVLVSVLWFRESPALVWLLLA